MRVRFLLAIEWMFATTVAGRFVGGIAGYAVASTVGATLVGGVLAGAVTGIAMSAILQARDTGAPA